MEPDFSFEKKPVFHLIKASFLLSRMYMFKTGNSVCTRLRFVRVEAGWLWTSCFLFSFLEWKQHFLMEFFNSLDLQVLSDDILMIFQNLSDVTELRTTVIGCICSVDGISVNTRPTLFWGAYRGVLEAVFDLAAFSFASSGGLSLVPLSFTLMETKFLIF